MLNIDLRIYNLHERLSLINILDLANPGFQEEEEEVDAEEESIDYVEAEEEQDLCPTTFDTYPDASCILYDDEKCNGQEGVKEMGNGDIAMNIETMYSFDIESVSVRQGCTLTIFSGKFRCISY